MQFAMQIDRMRRGTFGSALGFFNLLLGYNTEDGDFVPLLVVKELVVKSGKNGLYYQAPAKQRLDKQKNPVMKKGNDGNEYPIWDAYVDLAMVEGEDGSWKPSPEAFDCRKEIVRLMQEAYDAAGSAAKPAAKAAAKPAAKATAKAAPAAAGAKAESFSDFPEALDGEDDDLPF